MWQSAVDQLPSTAITRKHIKNSPRSTQKASFVMTVGKKFSVGATRPLVDQVQETGVKDGSLDNGLLEDLASVGLHAIQSATPVLEDFCRTYFMFHGLDEKNPECIFKYLPVLSFTESYIYQMDHLNEKIVTAKESKASVQNGRCNEEAYSTLPSSLIETIEKDPFRPLILKLEEQGLLTDRIRADFQRAPKYWDFERKLCGEPDNAKISIEDVMNTNRLRSLDYKILNLLLYHLQGKMVNDLHVEFLAEREFLGEIADDLLDYEDDVLENTFNMLRMFVRIYGASAAPNMLDLCIAKSEQKYLELSKAIDPELYKKYQRRCEETTNAGGKIAVYPVESWNIPPIIDDEKLYRSTMQT